MQFAVELRPIFETPIWRLIQNEPVDSRVEYEEEERGR